MQICICGWYFNEQLLDVMEHVNDKHPVTIIANRDKLPDRGYDFNYHVRENKGLEYGAYDYFLKNEWTGGSVLFCHDDMIIQPVIRDYTIIDPVELFDTVASLKQDVVYIFKNEHDRVTNFDMHGRVMYASSKFLRLLLDMNGGFPWDENNDGHTAGPRTDYCEHYNWAVEELKKFWKAQQFNGIVVESVIIPAFAYQIRGRQL
jgi:hypothetical protein